METMVPICGEYPGLGPTIFTPGSRAGDAKTEKGTTPAPLAVTPATAAPALTKSLLLRSMAPPFARQLGTMPLYQTLDLPRFGMQCFFALCLDRGVLWARHFRRWPIGSHLFLRLGQSRGALRDLWYDFGFSFYFVAYIAKTTCALDAAEGRKRHLSA